MPAFLFSPHGSPVTEVALYPCGAKAVSLVQLLNLASELWPHVSPDRIAVSPGLNCFYVSPGEPLSGSGAPDPAAL